MSRASAQIVTSEEDSEDFTYGNHVSKHGVWETLPRNCDGDAFKHMARFSRDHKIPVNKAKDPFKQAHRLADAYLVVLDLDLRTKKKVKEAKKAAEGVADKVPEEGIPAPSEMSVSNPVVRETEWDRRIRVLAESKVNKLVDIGETEEPTNVSTEVVEEASREPVTEEEVPDEEQTPSAEATEAPPVDGSDEIAATLEVVEAGSLPPEAQPNAPQPEVPAKEKLPERWQQKPVQQLRKVRQIQWDEGFFFHELWVADDGGEIAAHVAMATTVVSRDLLNHGVSSEDMSNIAVLVNSYRKRDLKLGLVIFSLNELLESDSGGFFAKVVMREVFVRFEAVSSKYQQVVKLRIENRREIIQQEKQDRHAG